mgnify:CR=1 FL=1
MNNFQFIQTHHSYQEGFSKPTEYVKQAKSLGLSSLALVDRSSLSGVVEFYDSCKKEGINVPIIPGLKPISTLKQLNLIPHRFHCDLPEPLIKEIIKCKDNSQVRQVGIEWCIEQSKELKSKNVPFLHYYSMGRSSNIKAVAESIF